jgi:hypothetical protein
MRIDIYDSLGSESDGYRNALKAQCAALGIQLDIGPPQIGTPATLTVIFANKASQWTDTQKRALQQVVDASALVLPVIEAGPDATYLPEAISKINAFKKHDTGTAWADGLVDETLSMAWLKRRARKVFISYRRIDSALIANQIFGRFNELGYEVFLDDATIERGVDFQRELKWWLNDADLLLALLSPRLTDSKWCAEELTFAQSHSIGIAALEWPSQLYEPNNTVAFAGKTHWPKQVLLDLTMDDQRMKLEWADFAGVNAGAPGADPKLEDRELTSEALERLVGFCARNRAASIRSRLNDLLPLVRDTLEKKGAKNINQAFSDLTFADQSGKSCFLRVLPFRPLPEHLYRAYKDGGSTHLSVCAYAECDVLDLRAQALRWFAEKTGIGSQVGAANSALWAFCGETLL